MCPSKTSSVRMDSQKKTAIIPMLKSLAPTYSEQFSFKGLDPFTRCKLGSV